MESIELINYRCFKYLQFSFKSKLNLLIGDNSSGKTTLMTALSSVLNSFFIGYSDEYTRFFGLSKKDFTISQTETGLVNEKPIDVRFRISDISGSLYLHSKKSRTLQKPLVNIEKWAKKFQEELFDEKNKQVSALPLFAAFSTNDIHSNRKLSQEPFKQYLHKPSFGYYECLQGDGFLPFWTKRLLILKEGGVGELEILGVMRAVVDALGEKGCNIVNDMSIRPQQGKVYYFLTDSRFVQTEELSDGYKRLVNIVVDLAFRCMLLNQGIYGDQSCKKTKGTVLIDEIDLHLHPTLQSRIIPGLRNAFPNLQFIVTTHAPMVMTGIPLSEDSIIYKLNYTIETDYTVTPIELYGLDASTIMEVALHTVPRSIDVDDRLKTLFNFIDADQYAEASKTLHTMRAQFGDNLPELAKAESMLNFLNGQQDDQDK